MLIKVCCIQDADELRLAAGAGATHVGLVAAMPSGPGPIGDEEIRHVAASAPDTVTPVLLTARVTVSEIVDHVRFTGARAVQLVSLVDASVRGGVRAALPGVEIIQVVHVEGAASIAVAEAAQEEADVVLLDSGRPSAPVPELGGTGRTHDWSVCARIVERVRTPVLLAGGLNPANVRGAVRSVRPAGVDVCSGLRDGTGRLVGRAVREFVAAARAVRTD